MVQTLAEAPIGRAAVVRSVAARGAAKRSLLEMGFHPGVSVKVERIGPHGEPMAVRLRKGRLSLSRREAEEIEVELAS